METLAVNLPYQSKCAARTPPTPIRPDMWRITDKLFLGQVADSQDAMALRAVGISHILNCAAELPCLYPANFEYLHLPLKDPDPSFASRITEACSFLDRATISGGGLVHCHGAVSRSPSVAIAYLCHKGRSLTEAAAVVSNIVATKPNRTFLNAIAAYFGETLTDVQLNSIEQQLMAAEGTARSN